MCYSRRRGWPNRSVQPREHAADAFNAGKVRFLVSTEAAAKAIDLQERCAVLVHVDMPLEPHAPSPAVGPLVSIWPEAPGFRLHSAESPNGEARIWDLLNEKLERIQLPFPR